jgi:hypothetical protein
MEKASILEVAKDNRKESRKEFREEFRVGRYQECHKECIMATRADNQPGF